MATGADAGGAQRELWREARRHIAEYEARSGELALDLAAEGKALAAAKDGLTVTTREAQRLRAAKDESERATLAEHDKMRALAEAREAELAESSRLAHQLASLRGELEEARMRAAANERERQEHLTDMRSHLGKLLAYASGTAAPCEDLAAEELQVPHSGDTMLTSQHHHQQQQQQLQGEQQEYQQGDGAFGAAGGSGAAHGDGYHGGEVCCGAADADMEGAMHRGAEGRLGEDYPQGEGVAGDGQDQHTQYAQEAIMQDASTAFNQDH